VAGNVLIGSCALTRVKIVAAKARKVERATGDIFYDVYCIIIIKRNPSSKDGGGES
jgi:hypothetical protein